MTEISFEKIILGMTDRMDCQLLMAFYTWVHYKTFIETLGAALPAVLHAVNQLSKSDQMEVLNHLKAQL